MPETVLAADALTVRRGRRTVLSGVSLTLEAGAAVHLAGANGSGKTSLLRVLAGLARPRGGELRRSGTCAFVPERVQLAPALRPGEWLRTMRSLRGLPPLDWARSDLDPSLLGRPSASLSKGMLQRVALVEALHARAAVLLLDEPFSGLDADGREWLAAQLAAASAAVILTDHAGGHRVPTARRLELRDGRCEEHDAPRPAALRITATRGDERLDRTLPEDESDALLASLLAGGWHVERVAR